MKNILFLSIIILILGSCTSVDTLIKDKEIDKAISYCDGKEENRNLCYEKIADNYFKKGDFLNSEKYYDIDFADNIKKRKLSSFNIAENLLAKKSYLEALKYYDKTNKRDEGYVKVADEYFKENQLSKALSLYTLLDYKKGIESIAARYNANGEYIRALNLFETLKLKGQYALDIANKLLKNKNFIDSALLYIFKGDLNKSRDSYKKFAYNLLKENDSINIINSKSPIVSVLLTDDYLFAINQKGHIYQGYSYSGEFKKVSSIALKREKVIRAKYLYKSNQIVLLTNAGLVFYDLVNKKIIRRLNKKITAFEITKNEDFLITANENIIAVRDFNTFDEMLYFKNHSARVSHILVLKNSVFSAGKDKLIRSWDIESGKELFVLRGHFQEITSLVLSKNNKSLASGSKDNTVIEWDLVKKKKRKKYKLKFNVNSLTYSNDSSKLIVGLDTRIIKVIDLIEGLIKNSPLFHSSNISVVAIDKHDNFIYSGDKSGRLFISKLDINLLIEQLFNKARLNKIEYSKVADIYFNNKKYNMAAKYYQISSKKNEGISKIGDAYFQMENYDEALKYYMMLKDKKHLERIADTYFKLGDYFQSSEYFFKSGDKAGVLKSAKMFLYEENYYDAIKLYAKLVKSYNLETEQEKVNAIFLTIADIFINMKKTDYRGSNDEKIISEVNNILNNWYEKRYEMAEEYFTKAGKSEEGYLKLAKLLMDDNKYEESLVFYEKIEDEKQKKALIKKCQKTAADYNFQKLSENYRNFIQLVKDDGDWDLITQNFNNSVLHAESSQKYYKILRDYKKLKKIKRVQRKLKSYKKSLGIQ